MRIAHAHEFCKLGHKDGDGELFNARSQNAGNKLKEDTVIADDTLSIDIK